MTKDEALKMAWTGLNVNEISFLEQQYGKINIHLLLDIEKILQNKNLIKNISDEKITLLFKDWEYIINTYGLDENDFKKMTLVILKEFT